MTINPRESNSIIQRRIRDDDLDQNQAITESEMGGDPRYDDKRALDLGQEQNLSTITQLPVILLVTKNDSYPDINQRRSYAEYFFQLPGPQGDLQCGMRIF